MKRVIVNFEKKSLRTVSLLKKDYLWSELLKLTISKADISLCDELVAVFDTKDEQLFIIEGGNTEFLKVLKELKADDYLPQDWYQKAEEGHVFTVELNNKI